MTIISPLMHLFNLLNFAVFPHKIGVINNVKQYFSSKDLNLEKTKSLHRSNNNACRCVVKHKLVYRKSGCWAGPVIVNRAIKHTVRIYESLMMDCIVLITVKR
jgi:hypothetical protein